MPLLRLHHFTEPPVSHLPVFCLECSLAQTNFCLLSLEAWKLRFRLRSTPLAAHFDSRSMLRKSWLKVLAKERVFPFGLHTIKKKADCN